MADETSTDINTAALPNGEDTGPAIGLISQYVKDLSFENPNAPAVYQWQSAPHIDVQFNIGADNVGETAVALFNDAQEQVLYVGKAKNLKKRVTSYTRVDRLPIRLQRGAAHDVDLGPARGGRLMPGRRPLLRGVHHLGVAAARLRGREDAEDHRHGDSEGDHQEPGDQARHLPDPLQPTDLGHLARLRVGAARAIRGVSDPGPGTLTVVDVHGHFETEANIVVGRCFPLHGLDSQLVDECPET